ncbi:hypothetical protein [Actinacidiphila cocklensis]|nr:hypothetical protein [Actinacidiphila cocklensis]WSX74245.1 hypothetical protein OH826_10415 [Streptomyces sp. NBC_00899]WSX79691.1 hypothetical protein OH826_41095 [Streptomyces sp. NBC_00899]
MSTTRWPGGELDAVDALVLTGHVARAEKRGSYAGGRRTTGAGCW